MKKIFYSLIAMAFAAFAFTSCEDVPEPYNNPNTNSSKQAETETDTTAQTGEGTIDSPYNVAKALAIVKNGTYSGNNVYVKGIISDIQEVQPSYGNATYFISDDGGTTSELEVYRGYSLGGQKFKSEDEIVVGDTVIVYGELIIYGNTIEFNQGNQIYYLNGKTASGGSDTPTADPSGKGTLDEPYNVAAISNFTKSLAADESSENLYVKGIISEIDTVQPSYGNATYYISDDGSTNGQFMVWRGYYLGNTKFTSEDQIKVGDEVIIYGSVCNYKGNTREFNMGNYIYSLNGKTSGGDAGGEEVEGAKGEGTQTSPYNVAKALNIINSKSYTSDNVYVEGIISQIDEVSTSYGNATYFISDDGTKTNQLEIYRGYYLGGKSFTSENQIKVGDKVIVYGVLTLYYSTAEMNQGNQLYSLNGNTSDSSDDKGDDSGGETSKTDVGTVSGNTISFSATDFGLADKADITTLTLVDGTTLTFAIGDGTNQPKYYSNGQNLRLYAKNTLTISSSTKKITNVVLNCTKNYTGNDQLYATASSATITPTKGDTEVTFSGFSGNSLTIVNDYTESKGGTQLRIVSAVITYEE